jgi:hypothetical protein
MFGSDWSHYILGQKLVQKLLKFLAESMKICGIKSHKPLFFEFTTQSPKEGKRVDPVIHLPCPTQPEWANLSKTVD